MAAKLFAERGYDATSVREIVEAAGVAKPTLYYYFRSKEGLGAGPVDRASVGPGVRRCDSSSRRRTTRSAAWKHHGGAVRLLPGGSGSGTVHLCLALRAARSEVAGELEPFKADLVGWTEAAVRRLAEAGIVARERVEACCSACRGLIVISTLDFLYRRQGVGSGPGEAAGR